MPLLQISQANAIDFKEPFQNAVLLAFSYRVICQIYSQRLWSTNLSPSCYYIDLLWNWQHRQYDWNTTMNKIFHASSQNPNSDDKNWFIADDSSYYNSLFSIEWSGCWPCPQCRRRVMLILTNSSQHIAAPPTPWINIHICHFSFYLGDLGRAQGDFGWYQNTLCIVLD